MTRTNLKTIAYWAATVLGPASFIIGGVLSFTTDPQMTEGLRHLGYPAYFPMILGSWKILGALAIVAPGLPRLKEWAYAGFFFELTGAAASHAFSGDSTTDIAIPLVFLALVLASWALSPEGRCLAAMPKPVPSSPILIDRLAPAAQ